MLWSDVNFLNFYLFFIYLKVNYVWKFFASLYSTSKKWFLHFSNLNIATNTGKIFYKGGRSTDRSTVDVDFFIYR